MGRTTTRPHRHAWVQLSYAIEGVLHVEAASHLFVAPPQRAIWIPAGLEHVVRTAPETEMRSLYLASDACARESSSCQVLMVTPLLRELIRRFGALPVEYVEDSADGRLVRVLLDQIEQANEVGLSLPWPSDVRLLPLCQRLQDQPEASISLHAWAAELGVSEKTLSRSFLKETGLTFRLWRQRLRLLHALSPLQRGVSVTEVAFSCGYNSTSAFIAAFSQLYGCTPGVFVREGKQPQ